MERFGLHSTRVLIDGSLQEATVFIEGKMIVGLDFRPMSIGQDHIQDFGDHVIMPGLIDSHVHINEPGRTDWEGFDTATRAAAAGGITTVVDMPLNSSPVTIDSRSFYKKLDAAQGQCHVNCGFWGGLIPSNVNQLPDLLNSGVLGIKIFLTHSGIEEFPNVAAADLERAAQALKEADVLLLAHCELEDGISHSQALDESPTKYIAYLNSRPRSWEDDAIKMMIDFSRQHDIRTHIVHLSSSNSIKQIAKAKDQGLRVTVECCPHYLYFNAADIPDGSTVHKCAPPIREKENNQQLWNALHTGLMDMVVTDHSPAPPSLKELDSGDFKKAWGGIAGLQFSFSVMYTLATQKGMGIPQLHKLMSSNVAQFLNLENRKGKIAAGYDADIVIWNPEEKFTVTKKQIFHKHKDSPYVGEELNGVIKQTYVNGNCVFDHGKFKNLNSGELILK